MSYTQAERMKHKVLMAMSYTNVNEKQLKEPTPSVERIIRSAVRDTRSEKFAPSKRQLACTLHRQADQLHRNGNYKAALVLYHRAARLYPQNDAHSVATKKISTGIVSSTSPSIRKFQALSTPTRSKKPSLQVSHPLLPAQDIQNLRRNSEDPPTDVKNDLRCYDTRKDLKEMRPLSEMELIGSQVMLSQLNEIACRTFHSLKKSFNKNHFEDTINIGNDLLRIISSGVDQYCYQVAAHRYLALAYLSLRRHDKAVEHSVKMIFAAKKSDDINLRLRSCAVFGKVHLVFGHLNAAVKGWENLLTSLKEAVPKAWLLHEIGRGHYEMRNYLKALEFSKRCCDWAAVGGSNKWMYHGKLLGGQAFICLGQFSEGLETLQRASNIAEIDNDSDMGRYIHNLIEKVSQAMRNPVKRVEKDCLTEIYSADLHVNEDDENPNDLGKFNNEFGYKLFTSRTRVIQKSVDENRENPINTQEPSMEAKINETSGIMNCCIVDKWKKHLEDSRRPHEPRPDHIESLLCPPTIKPSGISGFRGVELRQEEEGGGELCSNSSGGEDGNGCDKGDGNEDDSEDTSRTYGIEADLLYQCFVGNGGNSNDEEN
ncbi:tetratricopeptide repeat protein 25-like [Diachasma alloeum]|uniref:tetratricopeptide repeat protein 25-like n=1 Tax=Diachasma alloeum TaxID=454923 RepID=UPI0007384F47|nr:tetratricopeptide repeat protein 25-like [Diachasma alloeum]